jgi:uncharacterized protein (TIGR02246 family)
MRLLRLACPAVLAAALPFHPLAAQAPAREVTRPPAPAAASGEPEVRALVAAYDRAWAGRDAGAVAALLTDDAETVNRFGEWARPEGRAAHTRYIADLLAGPYRTHAPPAHLVERVRFVRPDVAVVHATARHDAVALPGGHTIPPFREVTTLVVVRGADGAWRITSTNLQNVAPPPGGPPAR